MPVCQRRVPDQSNDRTVSNHTNHRLHVTSECNYEKPAAVAAINARRRIGRIFQRRRIDTDFSCHSLTSIGHLRTGQYYRWDPDISHISACHSTPPTDMNAPAGSAASSPWQHATFLCSQHDNTMASLNTKSPGVQKSVSAV